MRRQQGWRGLIALVWAKDGVRVTGRTTVGLFPGGAVLVWHQCVAAGTATTITYPTPGPLSAFFTCTELLGRMGLLVTACASRPLPIPRSDFALSFIQRLCEMLQ
ncbi:Hypothetical protein NTJ_03400 [Nesidiocoris tenuis]|uniref:Secreted protein n=1 Tax=Nesidiocoris tenuis TaxID=355587 RepID=A0ABN7AJR6_9HEMI|nr:Hypothetical protein NTJ_03400 [Nesidiocoris tenuis]